MTKETIAATRPLRVLALAAATALQGQFCALQCRVALGLVSDKLQPATVFDDFAHCQNLIFNFSFLISSFLIPKPLSPAEGLEDSYLLTVAEGEFCPLATWHHLVVDGHGYATGRQHVFLCQLSESGDGSFAGDVVYDYFHIADAVCEKSCKVTKIYSNGDQ